MGQSTGAHLAVIMQRFVNAEIDAPVLFDQAQNLLGAEADAIEFLLTTLVEGGVALQPPQGRKALIRRLEQVAKGETSYTELDLWFFTLGQIEAIAGQTRADDPDVELLRTVVEWSQLWDDENERPSSLQFQQLADILTHAPNPKGCRSAMEQALSGEGGDAEN